VDLISNSNSAARHESGPTASLNYCTFWVTVIKSLLQPIALEISFKLIIVLVVKMFIIEIKIIYF
jgi:hypothetical protein